MEETDQEPIKHMCKFCNKSFACGRSLGGHMRSHVISFTDHNNGGFMNNNVTAIDAASNSNDLCYELRKDPKKTLKSKDSVEVEDHNSLIVLDKLCKECGKGFQSWKALFGHMKCHSNKVSNNKNSNLNQDSRNSESDNTNRVKKSRSKSRNRSVKRYIGNSTTDATTTASSSISMNANSNRISSNNASTSIVSEIDQEQESEVARCLMMLSRDEFGSSGYCNSSVLVNLTKVEGKNLIENGSTMKKLAKTEVGVDFLARSEEGCKGFGKIMIENNKFDDQIKSNFSKFESSSKRKFECATCNKSFDSYQALGGHKASHKKLKGCFDSKIQNENKIKHKPMLDHDQTINGYNQETSNNHQKSSNFDLGVACLTKTVATKLHECPICLKMFSSGQALGGHKRSHLIVEARSNQENNNVIVEPVREIRRFLDLNMPPQEEEEEEEMIKSSSTIEYKSCYLGLFSTS